MKNKLFVPLFWKFTIALTVIVALFGSINFYFINYAVYDLFEKEINRHGLTITKSIAERSVDDILYDDLSNLNKLVSDKMRIDANIAYIFIVDENNHLLAHTFNDMVPATLLGLKTNKTKESIQRVIYKNYPESTIRDFSIPILEGSIGKVRVGILEDSFNTSINQINSFFLLMILLFLALGVLGTFIFSYIITLPIKKISKMADNLDLNSNQIGIELIQKEGFLQKIFQHKKMEDEIDVLTDKFNPLCIYKNRNKSCSLTI
ncbi:hypothetical protein [Lutibacter sp.]|uniref:hypothetical protein n=1 Tax=Lutibacter sp. TaxID=1925666 RepID=UPI0027372D4B|nr:hypothetical protein [Lutibacter sp.]MDP3314163.1 hypothetical protein [Lutibacter sp.]